MSEIAARIAHCIDAILGYWDVDLVCRFASRSYGTWFGETTERLDGMRMQDVLGPHFPFHRPYLERALRGSMQRFECALPRVDGTTGYLLASYYPDVVDGAVRGIVAHATDVTELKTLERRLKASQAAAQHLASHDPLTGLPNRLVLDERMARAMEETLANGRALAVMTLDIDDFKGVNDCFGHAGGDAMLVEIAARIRDSLGPHDSAFRIGGDEFVILCANRSGYDFRETAAALLGALRRPLLLSGGGIVPTCSLGVAVFPRDAAVAKELLLRSDVALYASKRTGKGRYTLAR